MFCRVDWRRRIPRPPPLHPPPCAPLPVKSSASHRHPPRLSSSRPRRILLAIRPANTWLPPIRGRPSVTADDAYRAPLRLPGIKGLSCTNLSVVCRYSIFFLSFRNVYYSLTPPSNPLSSSSSTLPSISVAFSSKIMVAPDCDRSVSTSVPGSNLSHRNFWKRKARVARYISTPSFLLCCWAWQKDDVKRVSSQSQPPCCARFFSLKQNCQFFAPFLLCSIVSNLFCFSRIPSFFVIPMQVLSRPRRSSLCAVGTGNEWWRDPEAATELAIKNFDGVNMAGKDDTWRRDSS